MGTPRDAIVLAISTVLAIHLAVQVVARLTERAARRPDAAPPRVDASDSEPYPTGSRWV